MEMEMLGVVIGLPRGKYALPIGASTHDLESPILKQKHVKKGKGGRGCTETNRRPGEFDELK